MSHFLDLLAFKTEDNLPGIFPKNVVRIVRLFIHDIPRTDTARHKRVTRCSEHTNIQQQHSTEYICT